jgi:hypothetical protein
MADIHFIVHVIHELVPKYVVIRYQKGLTLVDVKHNNE